MKQYRAIDAVLEIVKDYPQVKAAFVKGSLAKGNGDEYSDVDFYCLVEDSKLPEFLPKRIEILQEYRPIIYWSEANFVGPQIVAVYDNGLHFDLYTVTLETFPMVGEFKTLYDPNNLLKQFSDQLNHSITEETLVKNFNSFSFTLLEFHAALCRQDLSWAARLASHLTGNLGIVLRHRYDAKNAQLGLKRLENSLPVNVKEELRSSIELLSGDTLAMGVLKLCSMMQKAILDLQTLTILTVDWKLFNYMRRRIGDIV